MNSKSILRGTLILGLIAGGAMAQSPVQLKVLPKSQRIPSPVPTAQQRQEKQEAKAIRLQGRLDIGNRATKLGGVPINITPASSVFPRQQFDRMPDLTRFDGRMATAFGRDDGKGGIDISLLIVQDPARVSSEAPRDRSWRVPGSDVAGQYSDDAPY